MSTVDMLRDPITSDWTIDLDKRRARVTFFPGPPNSAKHAEAVARESMPKGWVFGGAVRNRTPGWWRVWAYLPSTERSDAGNE